MIIDVSQPGVCRDVECRRRVFWRIEKSGKRNPYDPPEPCPRCKGGGVDPTAANGDFVQCSKCDGKGQIQVSHFATCVARENFRGKK